MRVARSTLLFMALAGAALAPPLAAVTASEAHASVSVAVGFEALVKDADAVCVIVPQESKSLWEDGRIYTYTRLKVEQGVAGELGTGSEAWVRTMGGVVGKLGQMVDGEPVFVVGKPSLLFLHKFSPAADKERKLAGVWEVSARSQGQYPVITGEDTARIRKIVRSANLGVLLPPRPAQTGGVSAATQTTTEPQRAPEATVFAEAAKIRLAGEVLHERPLDEAAREIAAAWKRLHPAPAAPAAPAK